MRSALLVANADAGASDQDRVRTAVDRLKREGLDVEVVTSAGSDSLDGLLARRGDRDIVVAGGDGSLHTIVEALVRRDELSEPTLGLIPLGTGNDFARSLGIPLDVGSAASVCARGVPRQLDLLVDSDDGVVVNAVNLGVGAEATQRAGALKRKLGRAAYVAGALLAGLTAKGVRLRVEADGQLLTDGSVRVLQVGIGNGRFVGGGTPLMPEAEPSDGRVDVVVSLAVGPLRRLVYALEVKLRRHLRRRDVRFARAEIVRVSGEEYWCSADGELSGPLTDRSWSVRPGAFTMTLPHAAR